ncbi:hypothetical protein [Filimonas effusa]|uniref:Uncharacterized protein n=1 Tax=Filimonas effusa TaxID=2508721 RepID=A0A4Q1DEX7_9BACT|nr:hypothetical protein [Filimonas effusa]RXK87243.1 hypothetical protein ESB13_10810 [Filimonas effusa]
MACDNLYDYIGRWMQYIWSHSSDSIELIHPDVPLNELNGIDLGLCFCIGVEQGYLILRTKQGVFKMKHCDKIELITPSPFFWGDCVSVVSSPKVHGIIDLILWDSSKKMYKYAILINDKPASRYYNSEALVLCEQW